MGKHNIGIDELIATKLTREPFEFAAVSHPDVRLQQFSVGKLLSAIGTRKRFAERLMTPLVDAHFGLFGERLVAVGTLVRTFVGVPTPMV